MSDKKIVGKTKEGRAVFQYKFSLEDSKNITVKMKEAEKRVFFGITKNRPFVMK